MYLYEWFVYDGRDDVDYAELSRRVEKKISEDNDNAPITVKDSLSSIPHDNESLYAYNHVYIDVRTPNDEKRGIITFFLGFGGGLLVRMVVMISYLLALSLLTGRTSTGEPSTQAHQIWMLVAITFPATGLYFFFKYVFPFLRLESFTSRRLIVRFNRITKKVYLLRPKNIGGIVALDWDKTEVGLDPSMSELDGTGGYVILGWDKGAVSDADGKPIDDMEITFVGRPARNTSELLAFWEYIRRYMEDGPAAAPPPKKLLSKFPWPCLSLKAAWGLDTSFLRNPGLWIFLVVNLMLLPAILVHALGHWISLLLCYEPRFPKAIEDAGKSPTP